MLFFQRLLLPLLFCAWVSPALAVVETYEFKNDEERARYQHFTEVLRCPKCQNQNLSGSNSPIAKDLRRELAKQIQQGGNDDSIIDFMVSRYGDYVLYDPQFKANTWVLWLAPAIFLVLGLGFLLSFIRSKKSAAINRQNNQAANKADNNRASYQRLDQSESKNKSKNESQKLTILVLAITLVSVSVAAILLYQHLGASQQVAITELTEQFYAEQRLANEQQRPVDLTVATELVTKLEAELKQYSVDDPEKWGWHYLLASTYAQMGNFEKGMPLYKQYLMAYPTHERVLTEYIQFLYIAADYQLTDQIHFVVERALTLNPANGQILGLMAMHYYQTGDFPKAIDYWEKMLAITPANSEGYALIENALERTRQHMLEAP